VTEIHTEPAPRRLETEARIGFLGDTHGNLRHVLDAANLLLTFDVRVLVVLGDFGFIWKKVETHPSDLNRLSLYLTTAGQVLYFVDGNHENHEKLNAIPVDADGLRRVVPGIVHLPRGYRTTLVSGRSLAVLGGANSVDYEHRTLGVSWWFEESITDADLEHLGTERADILIGHDAPLNLTRLDGMLARTERYWSPDAIAYSHAGRRMFHRGFLQVRPQLYLGGHYHFHLDETVTLGLGADAFETRVAILDRDGAKYRDTLAILDVETFQLEYPDMD
jgi:predicted phosphodiesterase